MTTPIRIITNNEKWIFMKKFSVLFNLFFFVASIVSSSFATALDAPASNAWQYGSFYTMCDTAVAPEHAIPFDCESVFHTKGIEHPAGSGDFVLKETGIYRVTYSVSLKERECDRDCNRRVALTLNGHVVRGSEMFVGDCDQLSTLTLLIKVCGASCCDHVLRVINNNCLINGWHNICLKAGCEENSRPHHRRKK